MSSIRSRAWRNAMVGAINAGLAQGCFELQCGTGPTDRQHRVYRFTLGDDIPAIASVADIGSKHIARLQKLRQQLLQDPRLRENFVSGVFANDQKLPDVQNIRARLRKR